MYKFCYIYTFKFCFVFVHSLCFVAWKDSQCSYFGQFWWVAGLEKRLTWKVHRRRAQIWKKVISCSSITASLSRFIGPVLTGDIMYIIFKYQDTTDSLKGMLYLAVILLLFCSASDLIWISLIKNGPSIC